MRSWESVAMNPATERDRLSDVLARVAERSLFAFAEPADPAGISTEVDGGWIEARVSFRGPFSGVMTLVVPATLARQLCSAFLGQDPDEPLEDEALCDFVGEVSNMVCGAWLTGIDAASCFDLAHPEARPIGVAPRGDV